MKKLRQVQWFSQGCPAGKCWDWDSSLTWKCKRLQFRDGRGLCSPERKELLKFVLHFGMKDQVQWFPTLLNWYFFPDIFFTYFISPIGYILNAIKDSKITFLMVGKVRAVEMTKCLPCLQGKMPSSTSICLERLSKDVQGVPKPG